MTMGTLFFVVVGVGVTSTVLTDLLVLLDTPRPERPARKTA